MKRMCLLLVLLSLMWAPGLTHAEEIVYFDNYPKIQRLQGVILFPAEIQEVTVTHNGDTHTQYKCKLYRLKDEGQPIYKDRAMWIRENKHLLYEVLYGNLKNIVNAIERGETAQLKTTADAKEQDLLQAAEKETVTK